MYEEAQKDPDGRDARSTASYSSVFTGIKILHWAVLLRECSCSNSAGCCLAVEGFHEEPQTATQRLGDPATV